MDLVTRLIWPLLLAGAAIVWLLGAMGALPAVALDLIRRGWPALLISLGLLLLLGRRVRFGSALAIILSAGLVAGVMLYAYNQQRGQYREDYREPVDVAIAPEVATISADLSLLQTDVEIRAAPDGDRAIRGEFVGSLESLVSVDFSADGDAGTLTLRETARNPVPLLERVGRGRLVLSVPSDVVFEAITVSAGQSGATLDLSAASVRRLSVALQSGNIDVRFGAEPGLIGDLRTGAGDAAVTIPPDVPAEIALRREGAVAFDEDLYTRRIDNVLVPRAAAQMQITIDAPGTVTVQ
jgi:hypothetical protein